MASADGVLDVAAVHQRLEQVPGVSRVELKESADGHVACQLEALPGRHIRPDVARSVVNAGWNLTEIRAIGRSLEEIFLSLTASEDKEVVPAPKEAVHQDVEGGKK